MSKLITVILSLYKNDNSEHLKLSLDSILNQSYKDCFILIGVDGPISDDLVRILKLYEDNSRILIFWYSLNRGLTAVLNDLIKEALKLNPAFIARMDADDIAKLDRFEKQLKFLENNPNVDVLGGAIEEIDFNGKSRGKVIRYPLSHEECYNFFSYRNPLAHPAVIFRPSFFEKAGLYRLEYKKNQDTALWYDGFANGCVFANLSDIILSFRVSSDMFKRRGGLKFSIDILKLRLKINVGLGFGVKSYILAYCYFLMAVSPSVIKKIAYKYLR